MLEQFLNHIRQNHLCDPTRKILLAVSGGVDSMVMLHLFHHAGFQAGVAHCNFQLRPDEAPQDEALVAHVCAGLGVPFFVKRFSTAEYAATKGVSVQVAARELRYAFFRDLCDEHNYGVIATAHHLNDSIETVLMNLVRGTGIDGLTGIPLVNGRVIRPLLFATRDEIMQYAVENRLQWREDSSNRENHYSRNLVRNEIIPLLRQLNPGIEGSFAQTIRRLRGTREFAAQRLRSLREESVTTDGEHLHIRTEKLRGNDGAALALWEWIGDYGFRFDQCSLMLEEHQTGKHFYSSTHEVLVNRGELIVIPKKDRLEEYHSIDSTPAVIHTEHWDIKTTVVQGAFNPALPASVAQLDLHQLQFPLICRKWEPGDSFVPLGMRQRKKLSDFFIDIKLPMSEKSRAIVVESGGEIVWVAGHRISNNARITSATREIFIMELKPASREPADKTQH